VPVPTLALHSYIRHLFPHRSARLCVLLVSCVSPCLPSLCPPLTPTPYTPSLLCRLNSRDRIRTKLAAGVEDGIVINPSVQAAGSVSTPGPNPSRDNTEGGVTRGGALGSERAKCLDSARRDVPGMDTLPFVDNSFWRLVSSLSFLP
jgi:hypothetical protein